MTNTLLRAGTLACALMTSTCLTAPAFAQAQPSVYQHVDQYGVDLTDGSFNFSLAEGSIGSGEGAIQLVRHYGVGGPSDNLTAGFRRTQTGNTQTGSVVISLTFGNRREDFTGAASAPSFTNEQGGGATLIKNSESSYTYTASDGTVTAYEMPPGLSDAPNNAYCSTNNQTLCVLVPTATTRPNGHSVTYDWDVGENCLGNGQCAQFWRLRGIDNSFGYSVRFTFVEPNNPGSGLPGADWHRRDDAELTNTAVSGSAVRTIDYDYPSTNVTQLTTDGGEIWLLTHTGQGLTAARAPGSTADDIGVTYVTGTAVVSQVTAGGVTAGYNRSVSGSTATMVRTDALSNTLTIVSDLNIGRPTSATDEAGRTTTFNYDGDGRLTGAWLPEGNSTTTSYDARGNVVGVQRNSKGATLPVMATSAVYPSSCSNQVTCNLPESITDARGNVTEYTYDTTHGGVLTVTLPAPSSGAVRPQTRYSYTQASGQTEHLLAEISACAAGSTASPTCVGTADESRTELGYDGNGNVTSLTRRDGTGGLTAPSAMTYDAHGNLLTVDGPLSGTADTVRFRYDPARRRIGTVSPDPDGGGSLKHRAVKTTFDSRGLATVVETGTVDSQSDGDWAAFATLERVEQIYDGNRRPTEARLISGSTAYALTQTGYDSLGRVRCVAQRMNPAEYGSAQPNACDLDTPGTGANDFGPDRIARTSYDPVGRVNLVETGVGTADEADEAATTYRPNGQVETLIDAQGNKTTYQYDGHDRLYATLFPCAAAVSPCTLGASSASDYEAYSYDSVTINGVTHATPLLAGRRLRDGSVIVHSYDRLGRLVTRDLPDGGWYDADRHYTYDNLGRLTGAYGNGTVTRSWDALGRMTGETAAFGTTSYAYDAAGRRTRLTWPGGSLYVDYDYLVTGEVSAIRENGATSGAGVLATYAYDDRGRRTSLTRGNGTTTSYTYDPVSRLSQLVQNLNGTTNDLILDFEHNPAMQIVSNVRSNDGYSFVQANANVTDTVNGLNQVTNTGGTSVTHDGRGNVSAIGGNGYTYTGENLMLTGPGSVAFGYDPLLRLYYAADAPQVVAFGYDGASLTGEYDGTGTALRRYVHGPGVDEPLVWYEGSGLSTRRYFHQDERGSVIAVSDASGNLVGSINRYDEYGAPQGGSVTGRFGYTGQMWLPEVGMYYYRNRTYNPYLIRFMQPDPIGYNAGMNLYPYPTDPVNMTDPLGLDGCTGSRIAASCANDNSQGGVPSWSSGYSSAGWNGDFRGDAYLRNVRYHYEEGRYASGPREGELVYRIPTGVSWSYVGAFGSLDFSMSATGDLKGPGGMAQGSVEVCSRSGNCGPSSPATGQTMAAIMRDPDVVASMVGAWVQSFMPFHRHEHGFWISQRGSNYSANSLIHGRGSSIYAYYAPDGARIFFHTHPFSNQPQGFSSADQGTARTRGILSINLSNQYGFQWMDYRN